MKNKWSLVIVTLFLSRGVAVAQIPVEVFVGHKKTTVDVLFFRYIKNKEGQLDSLRANFLFFNRNRSTIDYAMTETTNLPQFGFTEAFSYNHKKFKGFAPVMVVSILNKGVYPKTGIQFAKVKKEYTIFSWLVAETLKTPTVDFFFLGRYTPKLTNQLNLFSQMEFVNAFPTVEQKSYSFIQRFRLGLKRKEFQFGIGLDLAQVGRNTFSTTENFGGFLRYEF